MTTAPIRTVGHVIQEQIHFGVLMSLGASGFVVGNMRYMEGIDAEGLAFTARIRPINAQGKRLTGARKMRVVITLNALDLYDVRVTHLHKDEPHYQGENIDVAMLNRVLLALDFDGDTVLNPRYV